MWLHLTVMYYTNVCRPHRVDNSLESGSDMGRPIAIIGDTQTCDLGFATDAFQLFFVVHKVKIGRPEIHTLFA